MRTNPNLSDGVAVAEPPPVPPAAPAAAPKGLSKLSFGKITTKKEEKTAYPVFPDTNGEAALIAARIIENTDAFDALDSALKVDKAELKMRVEPTYFTVNQGRHEVPSSVSIASPKGEVLVTFQNRYSTLPDEAGLLPILGERTATFFRQAFDLKIVGDKLPPATTQELLDELQSLFAKYGCLDALEVKAGIKPTKEFHAARHLQLTPAENLALEQACPIIAMIKTKGRK